ncbi:hypothetical protein C1I92_26890 [Jiangella anatolica]|uniref:Uncharacterized protein n=1 Tax=Jiangella anatolica TaxID=2670374 RepID=A0A2W2BVR4_9ACTN|nr:hypothetical protein C1I92_26890 [Jiangella anatolica]
MTDNRSVRAEDGASVRVCSTDELLRLEEVKARERDTQECAKKPATQHRRGDRRAENAPR